MEDDDLESIRARRMAEMQAQYGGGGGGGGGGPSQEEQMEKARQMADMKHSILSQVLDQPARARLNTIAVAKPEKAKMVENMLIQMAKSGQIQNKIGEDQLKGLLERVSEQTQKKTTVKFKRRVLDDSDED
ncbi:programmed cell death protein 5-like [Pecten maximus]|uniref:programmed cell death protein 5-like n=1 Tax=Pecten maximus TaxID=6579 RepID=UPI001458646F|nr:programmed cell death protein 5-like [Pecten maximus]XP_033754048.1 programmed cell death protein 5-like [Pecten maximus]